MASQTENILAAQDTLALWLPGQAVSYALGILPPSSRGHNIPPEVGRTSITNEEAVARIG